MWKRKNIAKVLIVIGGFLCYMMADGCTFSIGILYSEFLHVFHQSHASTALLPALVYALPQFVAPIVCPLVDVIGSHWGAVAGGIFVSISVFVSRFVVSLELMYITMGLLLSIGLELTYVSAILEVTKGFNDDKFLGLALGFTVSGSGIGVFVFNPLLNYLINEYTWKGALTIESAIFFHIIFAGVIFKLASTFVSYSKYENVIMEKNSKINIEIINSDDNNHSIIETIPHSYSTTDFGSSTRIDDSSEPHTIIALSRPITKNFNQRSSVLLSMTQTKYCEPFHKPINCTLKSVSLDRRINTGDNFSVSLPVDERNASFVRRLSLYSNQNNMGSHRESQETLSSKPSLLYENSETEVLDTSYTKIKGVLNDIEKSNNSQNISQSKWRLFLAKLKVSFLSLFSQNLWKNWKLILFYVISFLFSFSVVVIWTFSYNHALNIGIDETKASFLISLTGAGSCIGQILFGLLSAYIPAILLYIIGCVFAGLVTIIMKQVSSYLTLLCLHFTFGFGQSVCYALFGVILLHFTSVKLYPAGLGIFLLVSGCGNLIGTLISGYICDVTSSCELAYLVSGSILLLCSVFAAPLVIMWRKTNLTKVNALEN